MLDVIDKLLTLQERDRNIVQLGEELRRIPPERNDLQFKVEAAQQTLEAGKLHLKQIESDRKRLELEVEQKQQLIEKYSLQQYQTKKNEEYRALEHEIANCKKDIHRLEDQELELMEKAEAGQKQAAEAAKEAQTVKKTVDDRLADLAKREQELEDQLAKLETGRDDLAAAVAPEVLSRYERLFKNKGGSVVVGVHRGVCGGCHMQLSRQIVVNCQAEQEIVTCVNCGRLLYYTRDMDVALME